MFNNSRIEKLETKATSAEYTLHKLTRDLRLLLDYLGLELTRDSIVDGLRLAPKKPEEAAKCALTDIDLDKVGNAILQALLREQIAHTKARQPEPEAADSAVEELSPCSALLEMISNPDVLAKIPAVAEELRQRGGVDWPIGEFLLAASRLEKRFTSGELK